MMVLYEDWTTGVLARNLYDRVCGRLPSGTATSLSVWPFDSLEDRGAERLAFHDLTEADLLMVATSGLQPLPAVVRSTLEKWLIAKEQVHLGLIGILHRVEEQEKELSPAHLYLESLARKARTEFFCRAMAAPGQNESALMSSRRPLTLDFVWDEDSSIHSVPISHWGINE